MIGRRRFLAAAFATLAPLSSQAVSHGRRRVTQDELDEAIALHRLWLEDRTRGRRVNFASCDLSGLDFGFSAQGQVVLRNADFTGADLNSIGGMMSTFTMLRYNTPTWPDPTSKLRSGLR